MAQDISMVNIGGHRVGMIGLREIFNDVREKGITDQEIIRHRILKMAKSKNYITRESEGQYADALLKEYKRFLGEEVEEEDLGIQIKILGPGCITCDRLEQEIIAVLAELDIVADLEHVRDTKEIGKYGVMGTPALIINRKVKSVGEVPGRAQIKRWITEAAE